MGGGKDGQIEQLDVSGYGESDQRHITPEAIRNCTAVGAAALHPGIKGSALPQG